MVIFEQQFHDNFCDNLLFLSSYSSKTIERENGRESIRTSCEYKRENCTKIIKKMVVHYHFPIFLSTMLVKVNIKQNFNLLNESSFSRSSRTPSF